MAEKAKAKQIQRQRLIVTAMRRLSWRPATLRPPFQFHSNRPVPFNKFCPTAQADDGNDTHKSRPLRTTSILRRRQDLSGADWRQLIGWYRIMYTSWRVDDREILLKRQQKFSSDLQAPAMETRSALPAAAPKPSTTGLFPYYRDRALCLALGAPHSLRDVDGGCGRGGRSEFRRETDAIALGHPKPSMS